MTKSQLNIAAMLRKAGRRVTTIDATDESNVKVTTSEPSPPDGCLHPKQRVVDGALVCSICGLTLIP